MGGMGPIINPKTRPLLDCREGLIEVRQISGELVPVRKQQLFAGADQKNAPLLPGISGTRTLAEAGPYCAKAAQNRGRPQGAPDAAHELESFVCGQILAYINFPGKSEFFDKCPGLIGAAASDGSQGDPGFAELIRNSHQGSHLLLGKNSAEMAEKGQQDLPIGPKGCQLYCIALSIPDGYTGEMRL